MVLHEVDTLRVLSDLVSEESDETIVSSLIGSAEHDVFVGVYTDSANGGYRFEYSFGDDDPEFEEQPLVLLYITLENPRDKRTVQRDVARTLLETFSSTFRLAEVR